MSPVLAHLNEILRDAADARADDRGAHTYAVARLRRGGWTVDATAIEDAVNALRDERDLRDGLITGYDYLDAPPPRPSADWLGEALQVVGAQYEQACAVLARRTVAGAA